MQKPDQRTHAIIQNRLATIQNTLANPIAMLMLKNTQKTLATF